MDAESAPRSGGRGGSYSSHVEINLEGDVRGLPRSDVPLASISCDGNMAFGGLFYCRVIAKLMRVATRSSAASSHKH